MDAARDLQGMSPAQQPRGRNSCAYSRQHGIPLPRTGFCLGIFRGFHSTTLQFNQPNETSLNRNGVTMFTAAEGRTASNIEATSPESSAIQSTSPSPHVEAASELGLEGRVDAGPHSLLGAPTPSKGRTSLFRR